MTNSGKSKEISSTMKLQEIYCIIPPYVTIVNFPLESITLSKNIYQSLNSQITIYLIIQQFDPNKAHNHNMIINQMLKICGKSVYRPLKLIFNEYILNGVFPSE